MQDSGTARFSFNMERSEDAKVLMMQVLDALQEKGYNPINQLVGYFMSGDPTYITNYKGARGIIRRMERDELLEVIVREYCERLADEN
ncbi:MAG: IreB family regulatory phosphoprotein [Clostridiales bacterium]|nr:IreB family regulatory phosphoprotein [Clostridiales bacterium]